MGLVIKASVYFCGKRTRHIFSENILYFLLMVLSENNFAEHNSPLMVIKNSSQIDDDFTYQCICLHLLKR